MNKKEMYDVLEAELKDCNVKFAELTEGQWRTAVLVILTKISHQLYINAELAPPTPEGEG